MHGVQQDSVKATVRLSPPYPGFSLLRSEKRPLLGDEGRQLDLETGMDPEGMEKTGKLRNPSGQII